MIKIHFTDYTGVNHIKCFSILVLEQFIDKNYTDFYTIEGLFLNDLPIDPKVILKISKSAYKLYSMD